MPGRRMLHLLENTEKRVNQNWLLWCNLNEVYAFKQQYPNMKFGLTDSLKQDQGI
jgi:hypothetical protein